MKKILLLVVLSFIGFLSFGQISISTNSSYSSVKETNGKKVVFWNRSGSTSNLVLTFGSSLPNLTSDYKNYSVSGLTMTFTKNSLSGDSLYTIESNDSTIAYLAVDCQVIESLGLTYVTNGNTLDVFNDNVYVREFDFFHVAIDNDTYVALGGSFYISNINDNSNPRVLKSASTGEVRVFVNGVNKRTLKFEDGDFTDTHKYKDSFKGLGLVYGDTVFFEFTNVFLRYANKYSIDTIRSQKYIVRKNYIQNYSNEDLVTNNDGIYQWTSNCSNSTLDLRFTYDVNPHFTGGAELGIDYESVLNSTTSNSIKIPFKYFNEIPNFDSYNPIQIELGNSNSGIYGRRLTVQVRRVEKEIEPSSLVSSSIIRNLDTLISCNSYPQIKNLSAEYLLKNGYRTFSYDSLFVNGLYVNNIHNALLSGDNLLKVKLNHKQIVDESNEFDPFTGDVTFSTCYYNIKEFVDSFQIVKKDNQPLPFSIVEDTDTILCPASSFSMEDTSSSSGFRWYKNQNIITYDKKYVAVLPGQYIYSKNSTDYKTCPESSNPINLFPNQNCQAYLSGTVRGQYTNGVYPPLAGITVKTDKGDVAVSDANGFYEFFLDPANLPTRVYVADPEYFAANTSVSFNVDFPMSTGRNLTTYLLKNKDLAVHLNSTRNRPGFTIPYTVSVENRGKTMLKSKVQVTLDPSLTYTTLDGENAPASVNGQVLQWDSVEVASGQSVILKFYATLDANTSLLGTTLQNSAQLSMSVADDVSSNDMVSYAPEVTGSYDPNDKLVTPQGAFTQGYVYDTTSFDYTIRFQNTGNDTAFTVRVQDIIDQDLDLTSINMIDASHAYRMSIKGDTVTWTFNDILLVDSTTNEPASHGFVRFHIEPKANNPQGTEITNLANIYFDFNEPIITNETVNIVDNQIVTSLEERFAKANGTLNVYPNPVTDDLYIQLSEQGEFVLYNQLGEKVYESQDLQKINLSGLSEGIYIYQVQTNTANYTGKVLKK